MPRTVSSSSQLGVAFPRGRPGVLGVVAVGWVAGLLWGGQAGDILVSGLGALRYDSRALKKSDLRVPPGPVLPAIRCFIVLTAVSALLFECGWYAEHSLCCTPQFVRNSAVKWAVNSGPPSVVMVSGMLKEANVSLSTAVRPAAPPVAGATMGQPENLSTTTRYQDPAWWK